MIDVNDSIKSATSGTTRSPSAALRVCWDRTQLTTQWFQLDQSPFDDEFVLTLNTYQNGETINEIISEIDNFKYVDESDYLISAEGLEELRGDDYQSVMSEADIVLDNTTQRFTPQVNKNLLANPDFESNFDSWSISSGGTIGNWQLVGGVDIVSGTQSMKILNPASQTVFIYSDSVDVASGIHYTASIFARGTGNIDLRVVAVGSGTQVVGSGTLSTALNSGTVQRFQMPYSLPTTAKEAYLRVGVSSGSMIVDGAQLEQSVEFTSYDSNFIGDKILPKRPTKIDILMLDKPGGTGGYIPKFSGLIENADPNIKGDIINIHCYDYATELQDIPAQSTSSGMGMYVNHYSHTLIRELGYKAGLTDGDMSIQSGSQIIPFAWFQEGSTWYYMQNIAEAEGGRVFFDQDGVLNFWGADYLDSNSGTQYNFTFDDNILDLNHRVDKDVIKNDIVVKSNVREVQNNQEIWSYGGVLQLEPGQSTEVWATIQDQEGRGLPCTSIDEPSVNGSTSYWKANTAYDGTGNDISSSIALLSWYAFATSAKMKFDNQGGSTAYLSIVLYGTPAKIVKEIEVQREDTDSINIYGRQTLQIENDYITDENYAVNTASDKLYNLKDPLTHVSVQVRGVPFLQVGDAINIEDGWSGNTRNLFIIRNRWQILDGGDFIQNLDLEQRTLADFFQLDEKTFDGPSVLQR